MNDAAGNTGTASQAVIVDLTGPAITIDAVAVDDVINVSEKSGALTVSGTCDRDGATILIKVGGNIYTATIADGAWSITMTAADVAALAEGTITVSATVVDEHGNVKTVTRDAVVDTVLPVVTLDIFCGDNILNLTEVSSDQILKGKVTGAAAGDTVTIQIGVHTYTATVGSDLTWSVTIKAADLKDLGDGVSTITATVTNAHGNTGTGTEVISVDAGLPGLIINPVTGDNIVNYLEHEGNVYITGSTIGLAIGTIITVTVHGQSYQAIVKAGEVWMCGIPKGDVAAWSGNETVKATATDSNGNPVSELVNFRVDLSGVAIIIDPISGSDNVINNQECQASFLIGGETYGVEEGQLVTLQFGGKTYTAAVNSEGNWSVTISAADMALLQNGGLVVQASVSSKAGETASTVSPAWVMLDLPTISITSMAGGDNIINIDESTKDLVISGVTNANTGCSVKVTLNGKDYYVRVQADSTWSVTVPAADVAALSAQDYTVEASVVDRYGNEGASSDTLHFDLTAPTAIFDVIAEDNVLNASEHAKGQLISGTTTNASEGDVIRLTIGGVTYETTVAADGSWVFGVPASIIKTLSEGENTLSLVIIDKAGNSSSTTKVITVETSLPSVTIDAIAVDDILNNVESKQPLAISGTTDAADGATILVTLGVKTYTATAANGAWTVNVSAADLAALGNVTWTVKAVVTDDYGNSNSATRDLVVDTTLPTITINIFAVDDVINATEAAASQELKGTVTNAKAGDSITVHIGTLTYTTTVQSDLTWSVTLTAVEIQSLGDGDFTVTAEVTTGSGNKSQGSRDIAVDAGLPALSIHAVTGDNIINAIEHTAPVIIMGTCTNVAAGALVTVTVNGVSHTGAVDANGHWQAAFTADEVSAWPVGPLEVKASVNNAAGNATLATDTVVVKLDGVAISIDNVTANSIVNATEKADKLTLTGKTVGVEADAIVTVRFGGKTYTTKTDASGNWSLDVSATDMAALPDGLSTIQVKVTNQAGNSATCSRDVPVDSVAPILSIDATAVDNVINIQEHGAAVTLTGKCDAVGQTITVTLNSKQYTCVVQSDHTWKVTVPQTDIEALTDGTVVISASVSDIAGNTTQTSSSVVVDISAPTLAFDANQVGDNFINATEHAQAQVITGTSTGLPEGSMITVKLKDASGVIKTWLTSVDENGKWSVGIDANTVSGLANGAYTLTADAKDTSGNPATQATHTVTVDTVAPTLSITSTTAGSDDVLNITEKSGALNIKGKCDLPDDSELTVYFNGKTYHPKVTDGEWSLDIPHDDIAGLADISYTLIVQAVDSIGNKTTISKAILVDVTVPTIAVNKVATDDVINSTESESDQTISGRVVNGAQGDKITVTLGDKTYTATVDADLKWSVTVPSADIIALDNGKNTISVTVTDNHGNTSAPFNYNIGIAIKTPAVTIDTIAGDDVINKLEHTQMLIIRGSSTDLAAGNSIAITISDGTNSKSYTAMIQSDGKSWFVTVPQADVSAWEDTATITVTASGTDSYGNVSPEATHTAEVNLIEASISIDAVATDDIINAAEKATALVLSGKTAYIEDGKSVTVKFAGKEYSATVTGGEWSVTVPSTDLAGLTEGNNHKVEVSVTNDIGSIAVSSRDVTVDTIAPMITINTMAGDNSLNAAELATDLAISGTASLDAAGKVLTVTFNNKTYTATVGTDGKWSLTVPSADLVNLSNGAYDVKAEVNDLAGNHGVISPIPQIQVAVVVPQIFIDPVAGDNYINAAERNSSTDLKITGYCINADAGEAVKVTFNGADYVTTVGADGKWSITVSAASINALTDGDIYVSATVSDDRGNSGNAAPIKVIVDTVAPTISLNNIAVDNIINSDEHMADAGQTISGTASVTEAGRTITVIVAGGSLTSPLVYNTTVGSDGKWSVTLSKGDMATMNDGNYSVTTSLMDVAGNSVTTPAKTVVVNTVAPTVVIDTFAGDSRVNNSEHSLQQVITGSSTAEAGQTITIVLGFGSSSAKTYTTTVGSDGKWSVTVPAADMSSFTDGDYVIRATVDNSIGNHGSAQQSIVVDTVKPVVAFDANIAGSDNVVNLAEQAAGLHVTGTSTGAEPGTSITIIFNGDTTNAYSATVGADGSWFFDLPGSAFDGLADGDYNITAVVTDKAGNQSDIASKTLTLNDVKPVIAIDPLTTDGVLNKNEAAANQTITGTTDAPDGQVVTINLNGKTYTATVADGKWSCIVSSADLSALTSGQSYDISATVSNTAGNTTTTTRPVPVDTTPPVAIIHITSLAVDSGLSNTDFITNDKNVELKGSLDMALGAGEKAQISLDGGATWIDLIIAADNSWSYTDTRDLADNTYQYQVRLVDLAGNIGSTDSKSVVIDTVAPDINTTINIASISDDSGISTTDFYTSDTTLTLRGALGAELLTGEHAQISLDGGATWVDVLVNGKDWSYVDTRTLADGEYIYKFRVVDVAGNIGAESTQKVVVDTVAPTVTPSITSISDDLGSSATDFKTKDTSLTINGTVNAAIAVGDIVQIRLNGGAWTEVTMAVDGLSWFYNAGTLAEGSYTVEVRVIDRAGNVGTGTASQVVVVDTSLSDAVITINSIDTDTGLFDTDFITSDTSITIKGSLDKALASDEWLEISTDGVTWVKVTMSGNNWSWVDGRVLTDGDYTYQVRIADVAGNTGTPVTQKVTVDTTVPNATATIVDYQDDQGSRQGTFGSDTWSDDRAPVLRGTLSQVLKAGEVVQILRNGVVVGMATVASDGVSWTFSDNMGAVLDGTYIYVARVCDLSGNYRDSAEFIYNLDTTTPDITALMTAFTTTDTTPILHGTFDKDFLPGYYLEVKVNGKTYTSEDGTVVVDIANGTWYLQIPDADLLAISATAYSVSLQVKTLAGNGNDALKTTSAVTVTQDVVDHIPNPASISTTDQDRTYTLAYTLGNNGLWILSDNNQFITYSSQTTSAKSNIGAPGNYAGGSFIDYDRDGDMDFMSQADRYNYLFYMAKNNGDGTFTATTGLAGNYAWMAPVVIFDREGDGYLDAFIGDNYNNSGNMAFNNKDGTFSAWDTNNFTGTVVEGNRVTAFTSSPMSSGVDLNNDGKVDLAIQSQGNGNNYSLSTMRNSGDGNFYWLQNITNFTHGASNRGEGLTATSLTWADFTGDGYMDLFVPMAYNSTNGSLWINDGTGKISKSTATFDAFDGRFSLAIDWNHDGKMDILKMTQSMNGSISLYQNNGNQTFTKSVVKTLSGSGTATGFSAQDLDWDGDRDLMIVSSSGSVTVVNNTESVPDRTSLNFRILDKNGVNVFYGNTVKLYDSNNNLVGTQMINPQSGIGTNDSSALISFYGLKSNETYHLELLYQENGISKVMSATTNYTWGGLQTGKAEDCYSLSVEASDATNNSIAAGFIGTGYNDTFFATKGTDSYDGSGGWNFSSDHGTWSATGGTDVIDFKLSTAGITLDLGSSSAQITGFNTVTLKNIEGVSGSDFADTLTGSAGDNQIEGRGGNDTINISNGGHDTLLYRLLKSADDDGGVGHDVITGFNVGTWEGTANTSRIDIHELLKDSGYDGTGSAHYVNNVAKLDSSAGDIDKYVKVVQNGDNVEIQIDRDGSSAPNSFTTIATLNNVHTDLATLLANHQLIVV
ncbi:Ig-like domain-containing protein [Atlantibacter subterraneus]|uniref:Ig-like domain-containing protein n=1 Tax=Atlantibacter subterraneus TaxID=255519 RepID=UPI0028ACCA76|nr:Ig-like domain-containing protein [Atlantibacter subterranea]